MFFLWQNLFLIFIYTFLLSPICWHLGTVGLISGLQLTHRQTQGLHLTEERVDVNLDNAASKYFNALFKKNLDYFLVTLHHSSSVSCCCCCWIVSKMKPWPRDYPPLSFTRVLHCERSKIDNSYFLAPATMKGSGFCSLVCNHRDSENC